jgi:TM2 domain-containing membrane protein YozV
MQNDANVPVVEEPQLAEPAIVEQTHVVETIQPIKKVHKQRHFLIAFFFSFMWGTWGVDRFYMGYIVTGILKLLTFGGLGIWTLVDFIFISSGFMKDKQGQPMLQAAEYKKFASRTVLWFAIILGVVVLANGLLAIYGIEQLITQFQSGGGGINGLLNASGISPSDLQKYGIDPSMLKNLGQ